MPLKLFSPHFLRTCIGLSLNALVVVLPLVAVAQQFSPPPPGSFKPPRSSLPERREGAGTRGPCIKGDKALTPIMPQTNPALTVSAYPSFFWYVPTTPAKIAELVVLDENDQELYKTTLPLTGKPGILSFSMPQTGTQPLEVGQTYHWQFSIVCSPQEPSENAFVEGWIQRVETTPALLSQLKAAKPRQYAAVYAATGIWDDALTTLAQLRLQRPGDPTVVNDWVTLLKSVELGHLAQEPLLP
ncbi:DUF928 domain-containing protein [Neosynechococcus sphagnicola]|uniref:DUF928 domain-containing protein n=1 Tax=Neosynechococcus sphagnicola TaxID=1501145 RepID=UPI0006910D9A|nr:DUF928 domain-containing protein [Neosynechococcus sphagnicola]